MEDELRMSEETARALMDIPKDAAMLLDADGFVLDANQTTAIRFGTTLDVLIGSKVWDLIPQDISKRIYSAFLQVLRSGDKVLSEDQYKGVWFETILYPIHGQKGKISQIAILTRNINERKQTEFPLRETSERLRSILSSLHESFVVVYDHNGKHLNVWMAHDLEKRYQIKADETLGKMVFEIFPPEMAQETLRSIQDVYKTGKSHLAKRAITYPGGTYWHDAKLTPLRDITGEVVAVVAYVRDITEEVKAGEVLKERESFLSSLVENAPVSITTVDRNGKILFMNRAFPGFEKKIFVGSIAYDHLPADRKENLKQVLDMVFQTGVTTEYESVIFTTDGKEIITFNRVTPIKKDGLIDSALFITTDITKRKRAEGRIKRLNQEFEQNLEVRTQQLTRANLDLRALVKAASIVNQSLEQENVLASILEQVLEAIPDCSANIMLIDGEEVYIAQHMGYDALSDDSITFSNIRIPLSNRLIKRILTSREQLIVSDVSLLEEWMRVPGTEWLRSYAASPLVIGEQVIGFLNIDSEKVKFFDSETTQLIRGFADYAATAINNAKLHSDLQALTRAAAVVNQSLDMNKVLFTILDQVSQVFSCRAANIMLINDDKAFIAQHKGYESTEDIIHLLEEIRFPLAHQLFKKMIDLDEAVVVPDVTKYEGWVHIPGLEWIQSYAAVPLRVGEEVIGFLNMDGERANACDEGTAQRLQAFANHASVAIHNAQLHTELKSAINRERNTRDQLVRVEHLASMGRLVASVAHEFNTPLQTVKNSLYLVDKEIGSNVQEARAFLDIAKKEVIHLSSLVDQLRDAFIPGRSANREPLKLKEILASTLTLTTHFLEENDIKCIQPEKSDQYELKGVRYQLVQVFTNIVLNAIEAMKPHRGELNIDVLDNKKKEFIGVRFSDSGSGISSEDIDHIFEPLYTTKEDGMGLGLAISHDIVQQHGGYIEVDSHRGQGASFTVWLPIYYQEDNKS